MSSCLCVCTNRHLCSLPVPPPCWIFPESSCGGWHINTPTRTHSASGTCNTALHNTSHAAVTLHIIFCNGGGGGGGGGEQMVYHHTHKFTSTLHTFRLHAFMDLNESMHAGLNPPPPPFTHSNQNFCYQTHKMKGLLRLALALLQLNEGALEGIPDYCSPLIRYQTCK